MNKSEFLSVLHGKISNLSETDINKWLDYYSEMIDDRIEDGMTEQQAVDELGSPENIAKDIFAATPITKIVKASVKPHHALRVWEIILLVLGFPLWFPLLIAFLAIFLSVYIVVWSLILVLYSVVITFGATAFAGIIGAFPFVFSGNFASALVFFGFGLCSVGFTIFLLLISNFVAKALIRLSKNIALTIKSWFIKRGDIQ